MILAEYRFTLAPDCDREKVDLWLTRKEKEIPGQITEKVGEVNPQSPGVSKQSWIRKVSDTLGMKHAWSGNVAYVTFEWHNLATLGLARLYFTGSKLPFAKVESFMDSQLKEPAKWFKGTVERRVSGKSQISVKNEWLLVARHGV
jgi:hypothetical protein